ncbi:MAG: hypothetical protein BMS9Abin37_0317 [Acidobacteriota bacterium]|nr:MAG: hypothetical protein BMS9Abin37_0317 [Acidobacteriota bacterium]
MSTKRRSKSRKNKQGLGGASGSETSQRTKLQSPSLIVVAFALVGVATFALVLLGTDPPPRPAPPPVVNPVDVWKALPADPVSYAPERDFALGRDDAAVSIVTFSDFECPYCQDAAVELASIYERYPDDVQIVFKNYPLDMSCNPNMPQPGHLYACKAAIMARCAGAQDRFWPMHDAIFALPELSVSALDALPAEIGLSAEAFATCVASEDVMEDLQADIDQGKGLGVTGTPAVFINGRKMSSFRAQTVAAIVDHIVSQGDP